MTDKRELYPDDFKAGKPRGTAALDEETRKRVCQAGGLAISRDRAYMAEIGRRGGISVSKNRAHMSAIGKKGGASGKGLVKPRREP